MLRNMRGLKAECYSPATDPRTLGVLQQDPSLIRIPLGIPLEKPHVSGQARPTGQSCGT